MCADGWFLAYNNRCYKVVSSAKKWQAAWDHCKSIGGYLAEMNSISDRESIGSALKSSGLQLDHHKLSCDRRDSSC